MRQIIRHQAAVEGVLARQASAADNFLLTDLPGLVDVAREHSGHEDCQRSGPWYGGSYTDSVTCLERGDLAGVEPSEAYMSAMEAHVFVSRKFQVVHDIVGSFVNVPAYLAGVPTHMRRRVRTTTTTAPIAVFAELTSSASIEADEIRKRGCAILALVRLLANMRPIALHVVVSLGSRAKANYLVTQVETVPLDLARAAHALTHPTISRAVGYGLLRALFRSDGDFAYGDVEIERINGPAIFGQLVPGSDVLYIPAIHRNDKSVSDPVAWIKDKLAQYGGQTVEQED